MLKEVEVVPILHLVVSQYSGKLRCHAALYIII